MSSSRAKGLIKQNTIRYNTIKCALLDGFIYRCVYNMFSSVSHESFFVLKISFFFFKHCSWSNSFACTQGFYSVHETHTQTTVRTQPILGFENISGYSVATSEVYKATNHSLKVTDGTPFFPSFFLICSKYSRV